MDNGQSFTIRMFPTNGIFEWTYEHDRQDFDCLTVVNTFTATEFLQYMQVSFTATTPDCRTDLKFFSTTSTSESEKNLHVVVWPTREPTFEGTLVNLDEGQTTTIAVRGANKFTVRVSE